MTVTIDVVQSRTVEAGDNESTYQVDTQVIRSVGIESEVFVFSTSTDAFEHVATVYEMQQYPNSKAQAQLDAKEYYRESQAVVLFTDENLATTSAAYTLARIQTLATEYQTANEDFVGAGTYTFTGGD